MKRLSRFFFSQSRGAARGTGRPQVSEDLYKSPSFPLLTTKRDSVVPRVAWVASMRDGPVGPPISLALSLSFSVYLSSVSLMKIQRFFSLCVSVFSDPLMKIQRFSLCVCVCICFLCLFVSLSLCLSYENSTYVSVSGLSVYVSVFCLSDEKERKSNIMFRERERERMREKVPEPVKKPKKRKHSELKRTDTDTDDLKNSARFYCKSPDQWLIVNKYGRDMTWTVCHRTRFQYTTEFIWIAV